MSGNQTEFQPYHVIECNFKITKLYIHLKWIKLKIQTCIKTKFFICYIDILISYYIYIYIYIYIYMYISVWTVNTLFF